MVSRGWRLEHSGKLGLSRNQGLSGVACKGVAWAKTIVMQMFKFIFRIAEFLLIIIVDYNYNILSFLFSLKFDLIGVEHPYLITYFMPIDYWEELTFHL